MNEEQTEVYYNFLMEVLQAVAESVVADHTNLNVCLSLARGKSR